eukprot:1865220-Rhodomonas_salina.1
MVHITVIIGNHGNQQLQRPERCIFTGSCARVGESRQKLGVGARRGVTRAANNTKRIQNCCRGWGTRVP